MGSLAGPESYDVAYDTVWVFCLLPSSNTIVIAESVIIIVILSIHYERQWLCTAIARPQRLFYVCCGDDMRQSGNESFADVCKWSVLFSSTVSPVFPSTPLSVGRGNSGEDEGSIGYRYIISTIIVNQ